MRMHTRESCAREMKLQIHSDRAGKGSGRGGLSLLPAGTPLRGSGREAARLCGRLGILNCVGVITPHVPAAETGRWFRSCSRPRNWRGCRQEGVIKPLPCFFSHRDISRSALAKRSWRARSGLKAAPPAPLAPARRQQDSPRAPSSSRPLPRHRAARPDAPFEIRGLSSTRGPLAREGSRLAPSQS